jgi:hypothetical protein
MADFSSVVVDMVFSSVMVDMVFTGGVDMSAVWDDACRSMLMAIDVDGCDMKGRKSVYYGWARANFRPQEAADSSYDVGKQVRAD